MSTAVALPPAGDASAAQRWRGAAPLHLGLVAVALAVWGLALRATHVADIDDVGLLGAFPPIYYAAVAILLGGFAAAVRARELPPGWVLGTYLAALIVVIHGTAPLLYDAPRYAWTYKHLAVTDLIAGTGHVDRSIDIYNNWPGFFALAAWLQRLSGVPMIDVAGWAQVFFNLVTVAAVQYAVGGLTSDRRRVWLAGALFVLGSWVGTDYFAPQALAFVLAFTLLGIALRATAPRRAPAWLRVELDAPAAERLGAGAALVAGAGCWLALLVSHQLTPVLVIAAVCGLAVVRRVPLWVPAAMLVTEVVWVALAWDYLDAHFQLFDAQGVTTPDPRAAAHTTPLAGVGWAALGSRVVTGTLVVLAGAGALRALRRRRVEASALAMIVAPCLVVPLQAYGGEGVFRAYVFALPWLALPAAGFLLDGVAEGVRRAAGLRLGLALAVLAAGLLPAYFGLEQANRITRDDVAAARWYERNAGGNALAIVAAANFPSPVTRSYAAMGLAPGGHGADVLAGYAQLTRLADGARGAREVTRFAATRPEAPTYVVLSGSQRRYAALYGTFRPGFLGGLERALARSPQFRRVFRAGESSIYQYAGPRTKS